MIANLSVIQNAAVGALVFHPVPLDLCPFLRDLADSVSVLFPAPELQLRLPETLKATADPALLETLEAAPRPRGIFAGVEVFKLQFESGEFDMVVRDLSAGTCRLYEVKHSAARADEQFRHLVDPELLSRTERAFGRIVARIVLYRGPDFDHDCGVSYRNVETYLKKLPESISAT